MSLEDFFYVLSDPILLGYMIIVGIVIFLFEFGGRIESWYSFKFHDYGTCPRCFGKLDNMWYLCCIKCYTTLSHSGHGDKI